MARKSKPELDEEGREIAETLAAARRVPHNFALFLGKDDFVFKAHRLKKTSVMRRLAKADGAGVKGAVGVLTVKGKQIELQVEDPGALPANYAKRFRKFLILRGLQMKVRVTSQAGEVLEDEDDTGPDTAQIDRHIDPRAADALDAELSKIRKRFVAMKGKLAKAVKVSPKGHRDRLLSAVEIYRDAVVIKNPKRAGQAVKVLQKLIVTTPAGSNAKGRLAEAGTDPVKLSGLKGLATKLSARAMADPGFLKRNYEGMQDMRAAMRAALAQNPAPEVEDLLREMDAGMGAALARKSEGG